MSPRTRNSAGRATRRDRARGRIALALGCALAAMPAAVPAQQWAPLARAPGAEIYFDPGSIREVDPGVFEIRLFTDAIGAACLRRDRDGDCDPAFLLARRIAVIRIRCQDMTYHVVEMWMGDAFGNWRQPSLMEYRHPLGWRYEIAPFTVEGIARDLVCATVPP
jgi:hypothetical protein